MSCIYCRRTPFPCFKVSLTFLCVGLQIKAMFLYIYSILYCKTIFYTRKSAKFIHVLYFNFAHENDSFENKYFSYIIFTYFSFIKFWGMYKFTISKQARETSTSVLEQRTKKMFYPKYIFTEYGICFAANTALASSLRWVI